MFAHSRWLERISCTLNSLNIIVALDHLTLSRLPFEGVRIDFIDTWALYMLKMTNGVFLMLVTLFYSLETLI